MKSMVIRFTGNKREVGILKSERQETSQDELVKDREQNVREKKNNYASIKFKCFDFNEMSTPVKPTACKADVNNNMEMVTAPKGKGNKKLDKEKKKYSQLINGNLVVAKDWNKNWAKRRKQQEQPREKINSKKTSSIEPGYHTSKDLEWDSDSSDGKSQRKHPNRRLQLERPDHEVPAKRARHERLKGLRSLVTKVNHQPKEKKAMQKKPPEKDTKQHAEVASKLWGKVLDSSCAWKGEEVYIKEVYETWDSDTEEEAVDYKGLLEEFMLKTLEEQMDKGKTLYEQRVDEMMRDPAGKHLVKEFYITPAQVEVLYQKMAQDDKAVECIERVCKEKEWPKPEFVCKVAGKHGFVYSCILKGKEFTPSKPASNEELAKELAAVELLEWLGFHQGAALSQQPLDQTYFP